MSTAAQTTRTGYEVSRPHGRCAACGQEITPKQKFMAALRETPEGFERLDLSLDCWQQLDRGGVLAFWQSVMPEPQAKKKTFIDDQVLCELFERLAEATEPLKVNFRFVLGLILMRKRLLIFESSRSEGEQQIWSVRMKGRDDTLDLLNPRLDEQQVLDVSRQMSEILNEEL